MSANSSSWTPERRAVMPRGFIVRIRLAFEQRGDKPYTPQRRRTRDLIVRIIAGRIASPRIDSVRRIAEELDIPLGELLALAGNVPPETVTAGKSEDVDIIHDRRVTELLEANNKLLERARRAERERDQMEAALHAAVKVMGQLAIRSDQKGSA